MDYRPLETLAEREEELEESSDVSSSPTPSTEVSAKIASVERRLAALTERLDALDDRLTDKAGSSTQQAITDILDQLPVGDISAKIDALTERLGDALPKTDGTQVRSAFTRAKQALAPLGALLIPFGIKAVGNVATKTPQGRAVATVGLPILALYLAYQAFSGEGDDVDLT